MQSAYRPGRSTETALLRIQDDIKRGMDAGVGNLLLLLDLSAAFDTIDHTILLERLEAVAGIRGAALAWLRSYLHDRTQSVIINGVRSTRLCGSQYWSSAGVGPGPPTLLGVCHTSAFCHRASPWSSPSRLCR